jgi:hypothetical protein
MAEKFDADKAADEINSMGLAGVKAKSFKVKSGFTEDEKKRIEKARKELEEELARQVDAGKD